MIIEKPKDHVVNEGDDVILTCRYFSDAVANVHWVKFEDDVNESDQSEKRNASHVVPHLETVVQVAM